MNQFSVVMSVYQADNPIHFSTAVSSVLKQTVVPSEIIIVVSGPIGDALNSKLLQFEKHNLIRLLRLSSNQGPGSRHAGIKTAKCDLIAIMDADDISLSNRFENQLEIFNKYSNIDVVGGFIEEFNDDNKNEKKIRKVALTHDELAKQTKWRNPMNNVTVMFRQSAYLAAGGYSPIYYVEDYDLWYKMILRGSKLYNIQKVLVKVRCNKGFANRRRGWKYFKQEYILVASMKESRFINTFQFTINLSLRFIVRLLPNFFVGIFYKVLLRN